MEEKHHQDGNKIGIIVLTIMFCYVIIFVLSLLRKYFKVLTKKYQKQTNMPVMVSELFSQSAAFCIWQNTLLQVRWKTVFKTLFAWNSRLINSYQIVLRRRVKCKSWDIKTRWKMLCTKFCWPFICHRLTKCGGKLVDPQWKMQSFGSYIKHHKDTIFWQL